MSVIEIGDIKARPGELKYGKLQCEPLPDAAETFIPLTVLNGVEEGPVLWIGATMHGCEIPGIEVIRRLTREVLDPQNLRGAIIGAAPLNPYGFRLRQHIVPQDGGNINAKFPGDPEGTISERIAHILYTEALPQCDYVIDFHANVWGGTEFMCATLCEDRDVLRRTLEMAEAFGFPLVQITRDMWNYDKSLIAWAQDMGKPAILPEPLRQSGWTQASIRASVCGVLNVMKWAGMIEGEIEPQTEIKVVGGHYASVNVRTRKSGIMDVLVEGGDWVEKGDLLAIVRDPWGNELDRVICPVRACVRSMHGEQIVYAGQIVGTLLEPRRRAELWGIE